MCVYIYMYIYIYVYYDISTSPMASGSKPRGVRCGARGLRT